MVRKDFMAGCGEKVPRGDSETCCKNSPPHRSSDDIHFAIDDGCRVICPRLQDIACSVDTEGHTWCPADG